MRLKRLGEFAPLENELIVSAETLIQRQRDRIGQLKARIKELEISNSSQNNKAWTEIEHLRADNANLRLEIDLLQGELLAHIDIDDSNADERKLLRKDLEVANTKLHNLSQELEETRRHLDVMPQENQELRLANQRLEEKLDEMKPTAENLLNMEHFRLVERVEKLKREIKEYEYGIRALKIKEEESRASQAAAADAELELMEALEKVKYQKKIIGTLQATVDALNREKALMPPTLLMVKHPPKREDRDAALDQWLDERIKAIEPLFTEISEKVQTSYGGSRPDGVGEAVSVGVFKQLMETINQVTQRQSDIDNKAEKLRQLDAREMSRTEGLHCVIRDLAGVKFPKDPQEVFEFVSNRVAISIEQKGLLLMEKIFVFRNGSLLIFNEDEAYQAEHTLDVGKCVVTWRADRKAFAIRHEIASHEVEGHWIQLNSSDDFDRLFLAGQYAGLIERGILAEDGMVRMYGVLISPDDCHPADRHGAPFAKYNVDIMIDHGKGEIGFISEQGGVPFLKINASETTFYPDSVSHCLRFWVGLTDPIPLAIFTTAKTKDFYEKNLAPLLKIKWNKTAERPPILTLPQFEHLKMELEAAHALINYQNLHQQQSGAMSPKEKRPEDTVSSAKVEAFEPFRIFQGKLELYDRAGGDPLLVLLNNEIIGRFDDLAQRFELTKVDANGNPLNDFVFEFADKDVYENYKAKLSENGFFKRSSDKVAQNFEEYAVVEKGVLRMYGKQGEAVTVLSASSQVIADPIRKEISILEKYGPTGKARRYKLDCANDTEYQNWSWGLGFGGFIKDRENIPEVLSAMKRFKFPIQMTGPTPPEDLNQWVKIDNNGIRVYLLAGDEVPAYVCRSGQGILSRNVRYRLIQIKRNVGQPQEDRLNLMLPTIAAFDQLIDRLNSNGFEILNLDTPSAVSIPPLFKGRVVLARRRGLIYWRSGCKNISKDEPTWVFPKDIYQAILSERGTNRMVFTIKNTAPRTILESQKVIPSFQVRLKPNEINKWKLAAYTAGLQVDYPVHSPRYKRLNEAQLAQKAPIHMFMFSPKQNMNKYTPLGIKILQRKFSQRATKEAKERFRRMITDKPATANVGFTVESEVSAPVSPGSKRKPEPTITRYSVLGDISTGSGFVKQIQSGGSSPDFISKMPVKSPPPLHLKQLSAPDF